MFEWEIWTTRHGYFGGTCETEEEALAIFNKYVRSSQCIECTVSYQDSRGFGLIYLQYKAVKR